MAAADIGPLVAIVGETGTGKSALALALAAQLGGEIITADSRTVYKGMNIGTAKPSPAERQLVPHYGLDVVAPGERFSAYDFKRLAQDAIADIAARGKLPMLVGGTGLYIDAVLYDFPFRGAPDQRLRAALQQLSVQDLQRKIIAAGLPFPANASNPRHLIGLLENGPAAERSAQMRPRTVVLGLTAARDVLRSRIEQRVEAMLTAGLVEEVRALRERHGDVEALRAPGYKAVGAYLDGVLTLAQAADQFVRSDLQLAKRQRTWFKRNKSIHWLSSEDKFAEAVDIITTTLNK